MLSVSSITPSMNVSKDKNVSGKLAKYILYVLKCLEEDLLTIELQNKEIKRDFKIQEDSFIKFEIPNEVDRFIIRSSKESLTVFIVNVDHGTKEIITGGTLLLLFYGEDTNNNFINEFPDTKIIGHRGFGKQDIKETSKLIETNSDNLFDVFYENTVTSFNRAFQSGAKWIELDVQLTAEKEPIVFHDWSIENNPIHKMSLNEFYEQFYKHSDQNSLPNTLRWILPRLNEGLGINVEIKYPSHEEALLFGLNDLISVNEYVDSILRVLKENFKGKIIFSSFLPLVVLYLKQVMPKSKVLLAISKNAVKLKVKHTNSLDEAIMFCFNGGLDGVVTDYETIESNPSEAVMKCKKYDLNLYVYSKPVSDKQIADYLLDIGCDGIITDNIRGILTCN